MLPRTLFSEEHEMYRDQVRRFVEREIVPHHAKWEKEQCVPRSVWLAAGEAGLLCPAIPDEHGGAGGDRLHSAVVMEELARAGASGPGFSLHSDIVAPYILAYGTDEQKKRYLPAMAKGEIISAIAMSEPGAGSDLQGVRTTAIARGNGYLLNGSKTFITNGQNADVVIVVAKTDPSLGAKGITLFLVDAALPGFSKGRNLEKLGLHAQDTSELFFQDVALPGDARLGAEGQGFVLLMKELGWERLQIAIYGIAAAEAALQWTVDYARGRRVFGQTVFDFQTTKHKLAELKTEIQIGRVFVDRCIQQMMEGALDPSDAAMAKYWITDLQCKVMDQCLQIHGGYGYMMEYPIARAYADARVQRIYGGTNEIMKELIARTL
ncbi:MAG: acyl-CoA dehydrogenase family protein [Rhodomicrobium sp.]|jgi:acyl-CoA dehydrogenase